MVSKSHVNLQNVRTIPRAAVKRRARIGDGISAFADSQRGGTPRFQQSANALRVLFSLVGVHNSGPVPRIASVSLLNDVIALCHSQTSKVTVPHHASSGKPIHAVRREGAGDYSADSKSFLRSSLRSSRIELAISCQSISDIAAFKRSA